VGTGHLTQEQLLRYLDGELSQSAARNAQSHLRACCSCQAEVDRLKEQIAAILEAQATVIGPSLPPPPSPWPRLEPRLEKASRRKHPSIWSRLFPPVR